MDSRNQPSGPYPVPAPHPHQPYYQMNPTPATSVHGATSQPHSTPSSSRPSASPELSFSYQSQLQLQGMMDFSQSLPEPIQFGSYIQPQNQAQSQPRPQPHLYLDEADPENDNYISDEIDVEGEGDHGLLKISRDPHHSLSSSAESMADVHADGLEGKDSATRKKPRITLPRGRACVACRNRKLKCTGDVPCGTCQKAGLDCRYEELPRRRPKNVVLEERVAELEALLHIGPGEPVPRASLPHRLSHQSSDYSIPQTPDHPFGYDYRPHSGSSGSTSSGFPVMSNQPPSLSLHSYKDLPSHVATVNAGGAEISPGSPLELALIQTVLPYAAFNGIPLHQQRFLALVSLPPNNPDRPHPALLYILFAQAVRILENDVPLPKNPTPPQSLFPQLFHPPPLRPSMDRSYILSQVGGTSLSLLERARTHLDAGIRGVQKPFDLVRAAIGIAWYLYSMGRFIEGWNIPVSRLLISCGLHRITGNYIPPDGSNGANPDLVPRPYAPAHHYAHSHSRVGAPASQFPVVRMRPIIIPPARDEIELAERVMTFWAAKMQDWEAGTGWGWSVSLVDDSCTTEFGWGWGPVEVKPPQSAGQRFGIRDLYDPSSAMHSSPSADSTYVLGVKSLGLLHRSSALYDLAESSYPVPLGNGRFAPTHIPPLAAVRNVETALRLFRQNIPPSFAVTTTNTPAIDPKDAYDGFADPWWIMCHANLFTAEMIMWREMAHHHVDAYERAVCCARGLVDLIKRVSPENWANVDMIVVLDLSLCARFLHKEADRLRLCGQTQAAQCASDEAEILTTCLAGPFAKYMPMAQLHALIVQRVKEGWPEKEGEYERI
ncbi:hypothetical protein I317_04369 [Kwoniella heveanensis CBS 569]|nr:hypothetical protein I317_04369 [Kwoniella heveanensis CBS 569]